jgi:ABC-type sugar transport system permease subunit
MDQADDLKAFERRMIEIISSLQPSIWRWRFILIILILVTLITFYGLITGLSFSLTPSSSISPPSTAPDVNSDTSYLSIISSKLFRKEIYFSISFGLLICAFLFGIHRKMFASSILIRRFRDILADYNMSCDSNGRLIIKPRTTTYISGGS